MPGTQGTGMTEFAEDLRHHCRNPRCRTKAFCTRGCHSSFYLKRCLVCENDKPAGSTARRKLCRRPKCEGRYRKNSAHYSFLGADTTSAANVPRSAQSTGIKSADFDARPWHIVAGQKITAAVYHCATLPVDPDIAARVNAASDWGRIRRQRRTMIDAGGDFRASNDITRSVVNVGAFSARGLGTF